MTNELKCPERDTELLKIINNVYQAPEVKLELIIDIIDKEKAAAVQEERERVRGKIEAWGERVEDLVDVKSLIREIQG